MINKSNVKEPMPMLRDEERKTSFKEVEQWRTVGDSRDALRFPVI